MRYPAEQSAPDAGDASTRIPALPPVELRRDAVPEVGLAAALPAEIGTSAAGADVSSPAPRLGPNDETLDAFLPAATGGHDPTPERIGQYRIVRKVGEGGMGVVYEAEQLAPVRRTVALKVIKVGMDTKEVVARFDAERQALALMSHSGVARVFDAGMTAAGRPYFAMEFVQGVPLVEYCDRNRLTTRQRLELFVAICSAVQHAHQKGIIHRDLKPSNILVTTVDAKPVPKVIDFGIAKATTQTLTDQSIHTMHGALIGTPEYASPEQAMTGGLDVDTRADIYSLGVILYQLLTGTLPLDSRTLMRDGPGGIARVLREVEPPKPSTRLNQLRRDDPTLSGGTTFAHVAQSRGADHKSLTRQLQGDLDWITLKAMEKDRSRRYATAAELADDITRHLADEPVLARPPSTRYRVVKFMRRHRLGVAAFVTMLVLLVGGIVGTSAGMIRAWISQAQAENAQADAEGQRKHVQATLEQLQRARAFAQQETRKSIVAGLEAAERLLPGKAFDAERLAEPAYRAAAAALGEDDPLTLDAADVLARVRLARGMPADAEKLLRDVVDRTRRLSSATQPASAGLAAVAANPAGGRITPRGRFFADLAQALRARDADGPRSSPAKQEVVALYREALTAFRQDASDKSHLRLDVGTALASMLVADDDLPAAEQAYLSSLADHRALLGEKHERTRSIADRLTTVRVSAGNYAAALETSRDQLRLATSIDAPSEERITRQLDIADLLLRQNRKNEGKQAFDAAVAESRRLRTGADGPNQIRWRYLLLRSGLGDARRWASPYLRAHAWVAVNESLGRNSSRHFGADEVDLASATFSLERWDGTGTDKPASTSVAGGTLDDLRKLQDPPRGLYLLSIQCPRPGYADMRAAAWVMMADWNVSLHAAQGAIPPGSRSSALWTALHSKPFEQFHTPTLFMLDEGNYGERVLGLRLGGGPGGRTTDFAVRATTDISLPPGRYLSAVTADDGVNLHADEAIVVNDWRARVIQTDIVPMQFAGSPRHLRVEFFQAFGEYSLRVQFEPLAPEADAMVARALGADSSDNRRWLLRRGQWWERLGQWRESADCYRKAVETGVSLPWTELEIHLQALRGFGRASAQADEAAEVTTVVEQAAARARSPEVAAESLLYAARQHSLAGRDEPAGDLCTRAIDALASKKMLAEPRGAELGRRAILTRLGAPRVPNDGGIAAQVLSSLDEAMIEDRSLIPKLRNINAADLQWTLVRWQPPGNPVVGHGTFAGIAGTAAPPHDIYLLQLRVQTPEVSHTSAHWVLFARWQWSAFVPEAEGMFDRFALNGLITNPNRAVGQGESDSLAMLDCLAAEPIPDTPDIRYAMVADARLRLPTGRYRVIGSAADGLKVLFDDRRVIHVWPSRQAVRQDLTDVILSGASSCTVHVEHYRTGGDDKLMLRLQPLDPAADALARSLGRTSRSEESLLSDLTEAVREDSFHGWAFGTRGALHARAGRHDKAAADFAVATEIDSTEALWQAHRAVLAMRTGGEPAFTSVVAGWRRQALPEKDRTAAARMAVVLLLKPGKPEADRDKLDHLMGVATMPSPLGGTPPAARFSRAILEYRQGRLDAAEAFARGSPEMVSPPGHAVMCNLLLAMIERDRGHAEKAAEARQRAIAAQDAWSKQPELFDSFDALDWMICQELLKQSR
ncbi:serine/threonine-protein kinase [Humisphaera borealis]|uniref:Protein kinase n=1 Tax=Humisphaera borealis TaxID=2807512 RepID=A0A7M2X0V3_9BACT|nr:protein kinase [Humisphaera borealis]QOV91323.1 protein kinase [Humisphaera borealis]